MLMVKHPRPAIRTLHGWEISILRDSGAISEVSTTAGCKTEQIHTRATEPSRWLVTIHRGAFLPMPLQHRCWKSWSLSVTPAPSIPKTRGHPFTSQSRF